MLLSFVYFVTGGSIFGLIYLWFGCNKVFAGEYALKFPLHRDLENDIPGALFLIWLQYCFGCLDVLLNFVHVVICWLIFQLLYFKFSCNSCCSHLQIAYINCYFADSGSVYCSYYRFNYFYYNWIQVNILVVFQTDIILQQIKISVATVIENFYLL